MSSYFTLDTVGLVMPVGIYVLSPLVAGLPGFTSGLNHLVLYQFAESKQEAAKELFGKGANAQYVFALLGNSRHYSALLNGIGFAALYALSMPRWARGPLHLAIIIAFFLSMTVHCHHLMMVPDFVEPADLTVDGPVREMEVNFLFIDNFILVANVIGFFRSHMAAREILYPEAAPAPAATTAVAAKKKAAKKD